MGARRLHQVRPQPQLLGRGGGRRRRGDHPALRQRRHHGPGAQDRRNRLRPRSPRRPVRRSQGRPGHRRRRGHRERLHGAVVQHRRQQGGLRRLDVGARRHRLPRRPRLRDRSAGPRRRDARRLRNARLHDHPAVPHPLARRHRRIPADSTSKRPRSGSTRPATRSTARASGSTRMARSSTSGSRGRTRSPRTQRTPSSSSSGSAISESPSTRR